jgi:hypothetical protein
MALWLAPTSAVNKYCYIYIYMLQVLETLHLMCIYLYFYHISLQILNCIYKKFKNEKIPYSFLPSLL